MKIHIIIITLLLGVLQVSCSSKEDEPSFFSVSSDELLFESDGGEKIIEITSYSSWSYVCDADWITVRRNQNSLRVIVDENMTSDERSSSISIYIENSLQASISIKQEAFVGFGESMCQSTYEGGTFRLKHGFNEIPRLETKAEWCKAFCDKDSVTIIVDRNFDLQNRETVLHIAYSSNFFEVSIHQDRCPWYESFELIHVDGGSFYMGAQSADPTGQNYNVDAFSVESPVHKVNVNSFDISAFEVTQEQWVEAMGYNPSVSQLGGKYPVENISWNDVQEFVKKLNELSGKEYRLPTEAEWEYAAIGGIHQNSYQFSGADIASSVAWFYSNSGSMIHEVGQKLPNSLGIYDMTGNVSEWVYDWFSEYDWIELDNPVGSTNGTLKINRGGSCITSSKNCRNTYRNLNSPDDKSGEIGFRLLLVQ